VTLSAVQIAGIGMTSQRTRNRMRDRLREQGITNEQVLNVMASVPRHLFVDEAMATRAYEVPMVYTVERIKNLLEKARHRFRALEYRNVQARHSDGSWGWASNGPYEAIIVTAAPATVPEPLLEQLGIGGRMIVPVGKQRMDQRLTVITRTQSGFTEEQLSNVNFVPFLSGKS